LSLCAHVIAARRSAGVLSSSGIALPAYDRLPRPAGVT
jgi:hypothetical protein